MSVRGEFERILGDTTAALRVRGVPDLSERLERTASISGEVLSVRAGAVLAVIESISDDELRASVDHLASICRVIVGR